GLGRREEEVADLVEERRAQLLEEADARLGEQDLRLGGELLANAAHRLGCRAPDNAPAVAEDDVVGSQLREVKSDARACRAGPGYDDASHRSSALRSSSVNGRSGARTCSRMGTPRRCSTCFAAAWNGNCSSPSRSSSKSGPGMPRTAATTSLGNAAARPETTPAAPSSSPCRISASGPMKTSRPSIRYGAKRSQGLSDTFRPTKLLPRSRRSASTDS